MLINRFGTDAGIVALHHFNLHQQWKVRVEYAGEEPEVKTFFDEKKANDEFQDVCSTLQARSEVMEDL